jgi:hypothetical protein
MSTAILGLLLCLVLSLAIWVVYYKSGRVGGPQRYPSDFRSRHDQYDDTH